MANALEVRSRLAERPGFGRALASDALYRRLVQPLLLFSADEEERRAIPFLPGQYLLSLTEAVREARLAARAGIAGVLLSASPDRHDESALIAAQTDWLVPRAIRAIKDVAPDLGVATDVCVCAYVTHGQCVLFGEGRPDVAATYARLGEMAVAHAEAGADLLVLSGMLEGSVAAVRHALAEVGRADVAVAGAVKFSSTLYTPYRAAVGMARVTERAVPLLMPEDRAGAVDRATREAADALVVLPGVLALDVIGAVRDRARVPVASFQVAGEYQLLRAAAQEGMLDEASLLVETAQAARRAGADLVLSYAAIETAELLETVAV